MAPSDLPPLPLPAILWQRIAGELELSPQQTQIVELILRNACDKQIVAIMRLQRPTIRTYLGRIFSRLGVNDRLELVLLVMRLSHEIGHPQG